MEVSPVTRLARRLVGFVWLATWTMVLWLVGSPWRNLGGLVDERLRWLEWLVLMTAVPVGLTVGTFAREAAGPGTGRTHIGLLRFLLYPVGALTACALIGLVVLGQRDAIGVAVTAFLAYWAGLDLAFGAVPLMHGRPYRLTRPFDPEPELDTSEELDRWAPPWERF